MHLRVMRAGELVPCGGRGGDDDQSAPGTFCTGECDHGPFFSQLPGYTPSGRAPPALRRGRVNPHGHANPGEIHNQRINAELVEPPP